MKTVNIQSEGQTHKQTHSTSGRCEQIFLIHCKFPKHTLTEVQLHYSVTVDSSSHETALYFGTAIELLYSQVMCELMLRYNRTKKNIQHEVNF